MSGTTGYLAKELKYEQSPFKIDYSIKNLARMHLNENLVLPTTLLRSAIVRCIDKLDSRVYPSDYGEGEVFDLQIEIAKYCKCSSEMVSFGDGSDQLIDILCRMYMKKSSDALVTIDPTFSIYALMARRNGGRVSTVGVNPSNDSSEPFSMPLERVIKACKSRNAKILALASPNNPTGIQYPIEDLKAIVEALPRVRVLLDEAYVEYGRYSATSLLPDFENLIIMRTFSKAFGMASHRLGYFLSSNEEFAKAFNDEYQYPYPVTSLAVLLATMMLKLKDDVLKYAERTKALRKELIASLSKFESLNVVQDSDANFVVVQTDDAGRIAQDLISSYGIALKYIPRMAGEKEFLRITVGTRELNEKLLYALRRVLA